MAYLADVSRSGWTPLAHHAPEILDHVKILAQACRVIRGPEGERRVVDIGPVLSGFYIESENKRLSPGIWSHAAPVIEQGAGQVLPVAGPRWSQARPNTQTTPGTTPFGQQHPKGWPYLLVRALDADRQTTMAAPAFAGIVCPSFKQPVLGALGTRVWAVTPQGGLDHSIRTRIQSMLAVYRYPEEDDDWVLWSQRRTTENAGIAWQLGGAVASDGTGRFLGGGAVIDEPTGRGTGGEIIAFSTYRQGGPLYVGDQGCQHRRPGNADGQVITPLHLTTETLFAIPGNPRADAPIEFQGTYPEPSTAPLKTKAGIFLDLAKPHQVAGRGDYRGLWRLVAESFVTIIEKPKKEPPPLPPPEEPPGGDGVLLFPPGTFADPDTGEDLGGPRVGPVEPQPKGAPTLSAMSWRECRPLAGSSMEQAFSGMVFRAPDLRAGAADLRSATELSEQDLVEWAEQPAVLRLVSIGARTGNSRTLTREDCPPYKEVTTGPGVVWLMPPELCPEMLLDPDQDDPEGSPAANLGTAEASDSSFGLFRTSLMFATPTANGGAKDGFLQRLSGSLLEWSAVGSSGAESQVMTLRTSGILGLRNSGGFTGLIRPENLTASRSHYLPDESGTIPVREAMTAWFGDASDGDLTVDVGSSPVELEKDYFYDTLTVEAGATLDTKGHRIYCRSLVMENGGTIQNAGDDASGATKGNGATSGTLGGGKDGGPGGSGGSGGTAGVDANPGIGGAGGAASSGGVSGGAATEPAERPRALPQAAHLRDSSGTAYAGGAGGAGGDDSGASDGGGGGGGGGVIYIAARTIELEAGAVIDATGGAGGGGGATADGGGGGGGGTVIAVYQTESGLSAAVDVSGGAGGTATAGGTPGSAGSDGELIQLRTA